MSYTIKNLNEMEDHAAGHGMGETMAARFPHKELDADDTGVAYIVLRPGKRQPFAHRHNKAEEICVVLSGSGRAKLDDEVIDLETMDAIRIAPAVTRAFEAGDEGIELLVFGTHHEGDAEMVQEFWED